LAEAIIRTIPQYRLYATSLLFLYEGATKDEIDALDEESGIKYSPDVRVKIVDFAHAITDLHAAEVLSAPYPPSHPENADRGYIKGLASLKIYFQRCVSIPLCQFIFLIARLNCVDARIWKEQCGDEEMIDRVGSKSFWTRSSTAHSPFNRDDSLTVEDDKSRSDQIRSALDLASGTRDNEEAVVEGNDGWSDVSI